MPEDCKQNRISPDLSKGLSHEQVAQKTAAGQVNVSPEPMTKSTRQIICDNLFTSFNAIIVAIAACIALVGAYQNLLFLSIIVSNTLIGIIQEIRSKKTIEKLSVLSAPKARVLRDGAFSQIAVESLVLDDIIELSSGHQVCADCIVRKGQVEVNESLLTGEADPIYKHPGDFLLSGSFVISGRCLARVEHVGSENYATKIALEAKKTKKLHSELMSSLRKITSFTGLFILPFGLILFLRSYFLLHETIQTAVISSAAAIIGMFPQGLILLTSVSLAVGVIKLGRRRTLVQELFCIETLSRVDTLCLDKTGTLTTGEMSVQAILPLYPEGVLWSAEQAVRAYVTASTDSNATFSALKKHFEPLQANAVAHLPFSSEHKWGAVQFSDTGTFFLGAPDYLLPKSAPSLYRSTVQYHARNGCRVLLLSHSNAPLGKALPEDLSPVAIIVLCDTLRPEAKDTLQFFASQGVTVKLISGDHPLTVASLARQVGLQDANRYIDVSVLSPEELEKAADVYTIFGRVKPEQKRILVHALQAKGHTVAMTGDGVNDVLALKDADCSIAMASGSDAARQVAQLVLLDSDFSCLPEVVMEGRRVVNNITRTASLYLVKTIFSFLLAFVTIFTPFNYPFTPIQLTLISTFTVGIPSFFLALEPSRERIRGSFLSTVLQRALPGGIVIVLYVIVIQGIAPFFLLTALQTATLYVYLTGIASLLLLWRVSWPVNTMRCALCTTMTLGFFLAAYLFRDLIGLTVISGVLWPFGLVLSASCLPLMQLLSKWIRRSSWIHRLDRLS